MRSISGVLPPIITPYDQQGRLHGYALRELVEWYVAAGCHGLWVAGGTGEGISLSRDERIELAESVHEAVAGRLKLIFHVGAATTADALHAAGRCQQLGLDAICSVPPFFYGKSDDETVDYFRRLGDATDRPLWIYNLPDATGRPLSAPLVDRIARAVPTVAGMKHSGVNLDLLVDVQRLQPELTLFVGRGELFLAGLTLGARGVVCASVCLAPERFVAVHRAFAHGDLAAALAAQGQATRVKEIYTRFPVIGSTKRLNGEQIGLDCGDPRSPLAGISTKEEPQLLALAQQLGVLDPAAGRLERLGRLAAPR